MEIERNTRMTVLMSNYYKLFDIGWKNMIKCLSIENLPKTLFRKNTEVTSREYKDYKWKTSFSSSIFYSLSRITFHRAL